MKPLIVSFHTPDALYSERSNILRSSLERLGLEHRIIECDPIGDWARNNHIKPRVIQRFHADGARAVLWVDVDSIVWTDPQPHIDALGGADFGVAWHPYRDTEHVFASTLYFAASCRARDLIRDWIARCESGRTEGGGFDWRQSDQAHLQEALKAARQHGLRDGRFSPAMAFVHDTDRRRHGDSIKPVIEAFNVSWIGRNETRAEPRQIARVVDRG